MVISLENVSKDGFAGVKADDISSAFIFYKRLVSNTVGSDVKSEERESQND